MNLNINNLLRNKFFKNSILYTISSMMTPIIGLVMLPIFTKHLTPAEYGTMTTVLTIMGLMQFLLLLGLHGAVTRFFYDFLDQPEKQKEYIGSIFVFVLFFSTLIAIMLFIFNKPIGSLLFKNIPLNPYYFYLIGLSWIIALSALQTALFRVQEKAGLLVLFNVIKELLIMGCSSYLIINKGFGAEGQLISQLIITTIIVVIIFFIQFKFLKFNMQRTFVKQSLLFSIPLLPHVASSWIINSSDRVILEKFVGITEVGIYALAAQVSMVLGLFFSSINDALVPRYTRLRMEGHALKADKLLKIFFYVVISFGITSIPVAMYAIKLISSDDYYDAIALIPLLLVGKIFTGFYFIPVAKLFYEKKTKSIATSSTIAAIIHVAFNSILIPLLGLYGAIISSISAEIIRFLLIYRASMQHKATSSIEANKP
ncbi:lipopolysaccharide biosynthesis protein [Cohnella panacarvi]|uniref:lipopolysaccharide biosynthesis protein n=1 Tax=Cohnella panacarvi TaxID=400776 RepID=UPI000479F3CB|nr:oligosaccharide flippase family protein [Cohnella panacarvi]